MDDAYNLLLPTHLPLAIVSMVFVAPTGNVPATQGLRHLPTELRAPPALLVSSRRPLAIAKVCNITFTYVVIED